MEISNFPLETDKKKKQFTILLHYRKKYIIYLGVKYWLYE